MPRAGQIGWWYPSGTEGRAQWFEVTECAAGGFGGGGPAFQFIAGEFVGDVDQGGGGNLAEVDDPFADLGERDANQPTAALFGAALQGDHGAGGHQVAGAVVDGGNRVELRAWCLCRNDLGLATGDAADGLHDRVEAATGRPGAGVTEGAERDIDQAGAESYQFLRGQATVAQCAGAVALRENVGVADQVAQGFKLCRLAQVEIGGEFAEAGVELLVTEVGQMRGGDFQHVRAVFGEGTGTGGTGENAGDVDDPDSGERTGAGRQRFGWGVTDFDDFQQRQGGDGGGLGMVGPLGFGAHHAAGAFVGDDGFLEVERVPGGDGFGDGVAGFLAAEDFQGGGAVVGEIGVDVAPAAVFRRIDAHDRVAGGGNFTVTELHVLAGAEGGGGLADVDGDGLGAAGAVMPQAGGGEAGCGDGGGARLADAERRGQDGVGATGEGHGIRVGSGQAGAGQDGAEGCVRHGRILPWQGRIMPQLAVGANRVGCGAIWGHDHGNGIHQRFRGRSKLA